MLRILIPAVVFLLPCAANARDWQVDAAKSSLIFKGSYQKEAFDGSFKTFDATIAYDEANLAIAKFDVNVDLASAGTGNEERDDSLKGGDFFDVKKTPKAHFVTESFAKGADGSVEAKGTLTLHGQTKPVVLKVKFAGNGSAATLDVDTVLKRADFGLGAGSDWTDVGAEVPVHGHLVLTAK
jgi:polyisoprenoid-binding protein YceI